ncbi:G-type lectin S-receptor-like serine/threonine-protein kinase SD2-5 [Punica granatum]|uniref:Receptor-like serine/threonine-protein kinase n=1 Tax=Punica granatum TaxID=22663 RepID=A0A6P8BR25_PUNGR|nr:G-type lectin S-receptor-like serine/threonine-protein kinase SD2-5 [Punica granatum]XP_031373219.1 G-type lectin S-receptor-like serine/threonine-protein kinase SD2-5 [Punica granatum]XP_031373220.1 G-type lectin S-receptor-like serine/threonine-protein kinase SD2-5 [Punica granatum]XP_031373221.1 G-type lectin S-receptor-like serine/threonine-protein kinase SD2-5 [Punica granatum]XP_031373222.1 G-type lectin S-receptor-like serine/threonine-protein kinase SD2-5 [Punica granatum]XP_0313732
MGTLRMVGCSCILLLVISVAIPANGASYAGKLYPGFQGSQMSWIDNNGLFLLSESSNFAFGFQSYEDPDLFSLVIIHSITRTVIWSANPDTPVSRSDMFVFDKNGTAFLQKGGAVIWSAGSSQGGVSAMELQDSGNLVLLGKENETIWESFGHPTDTLLSNQDFVRGMRLVNRAKSKTSNLSYVLEIDSGDMVLFAAYGTRQPYWSMSKDRRKIINKAVSGVIAAASIDENSWRFYDANRTLVWQFVFSGNLEPNATWIAVLGGDGMISFSNLQSGSGPSATRIPIDPCATFEPCDPYMLCYSSDRCRCLPALSSRPGCGPGIDSTCNPETGAHSGLVDLVNAGDGIGYSSLGFVPPTMKSSDLNNCKSLCLGNCSCTALFFESSSGNCFLFNKIGALQSSGSDSSGFVSYIKVSSSGQNRKKNRLPYVIAIALPATLVILGLLVCALFIYVRRGKKSFKEAPLEDGSGEEDNFLGNLSGAPTRYSYQQLEAATNSFSVKLGQGGFGSVYRGALPDGTQLAVKKLESIGQGKKEFRSEVSIIGSIHHLHLVRLKGFCAQGSHRLLAYEYMSKGSLDQWIFPKKKKNNNNNEEEKEQMVLSWETRYQIALGTAKGLAYLHEDCDSKIVHCDIKPENVLLDENFLAKVSDFGLAKLMGREQSHVFTTLRGTRGYLAPEWITNHAISEKSDVYSYGMVLFELISGRKSFNPEETSEKCHFPSYAFKMMEEGKLREVLDSSLKIDERDERVLRVIKVALWCVQEDMSLRPSMAKVVQMLEGVSPVPQPPICSALAYRLNSRFFHGMIDEHTSSGTTSECIADSYLSDVRLSGPR